MNERIHKSIYNEEFLNAINYEDCESVLDVGCGVGNLSLRMASLVKEVYSMDYSPKMLEHLQINAREQNIENITTLHNSWYDSWDEIPKTDIVIASRSMEVKNMKDALEKLNNKANKRVYLTYKVGGSFVDQKILDVIQRDIIKKPDYIYLINILYSMGINASVNFIRSEGRSTLYTSKDKFIKSISWSISDLTKAEIQRLESYYDSLPSSREKENEYVSWAILSWSK